MHHGRCREQITVLPAHHANGIINALLRRCAPTWGCSPYLPGCRSNFLSLPVTRCARDPLGDVNPDDFVQLLHDHLSHQLLHDHL